MRLAVRNFMCYRDGVPDLDLEGIHVACLCGENGHGKSALLDAITWALWGKARARHQEELIHQGRRDMAVELDFSARDLRYRVMRRYSLSASGRQGTTLLELQVASGTSYRALTGNTVRETEVQIREIVHMDYDTFVNTAYLLQGRADMFTKSKPSQRKELLAEVLDLSHYQDLEELAKQRSRASGDSVRDREREIELRAQEVARVPEYEDALAAAKEAVVGIGPDVEAQRARVELLRQQVDSLRRHQDDLKVLTDRIATCRVEVDGLRRRERGHRSRIDEYAAVVARRDEITREHSKLDEAKIELERLNRAYRERTALEREQAKLEQAIAVMAERLSGQVAQLSNTITNGLEPAAARLPEIERGLRAVSADEASLDEREKAVSESRGEGHDISARIRYLDEANAGLLAGMEETRQKFDLLDQDDAECPVCRQPLEGDGREHLRREYRTQGEQAKADYGRNAAEQESLRHSHSKLLNGISQRESELGRSRREVQQRAAALGRDLQESRTAGDQLGPALGQLQEAKDLLEGRRFAGEERTALAQVDAKVSELEYDGEAHDLSRRRIENLGHYEELHRGLQQAVRALPEEREALQDVTQMLARRERELADDEARVETLTREIESLPSREAGLEEARVLHRDLESRRQDALVQERVMGEHLDRAARLGAEVRRLAAEHGRLAEEKAVYDELAVAFGKNGVQALIIETAIPQLQEDANELLGRLTDNNLHLKLQLQEGRRERRLGLPSEELDIKVADDLGTRSYETFSGGEAFRIDFALRIALSKLLARRSGAPLPTLFIDEGFGSQDASGQERLKEAIQSIQDDFEKIIVITHVEQVKDSFPTRIEVTKTPSGSTFVVV